MASEELKKSKKWPQILEVCMTEHYTLYTLYTLYTTSLHPTVFCSSLSHHLSNVGGYTDLRSFFFLFFANVVQLLLFVGNFINEGTFRGGINGFKLSSLAKVRPISVLSLLIA